MSSPMLAALTASALRPAIFVEATFATETLRIWSGVGSISWNGHSWIGVGSLGGIATIEEGANVQARGTSISLSGIDPESLADALQEIRIGRPVSIYFGSFAGDGSLIADPLVSWSGRTDQPIIDVLGTVATIALACESRLMDLDVGCDRRYTLEDSQLDHPGDLGMQFVNSLQQITIRWGSVPSATQNI